MSPTESAASAKPSAPLIPAWVLALLALAAGIAFHFYVQTSWKEHPHPSEHFAGVHATMGLLYSQRGMPEDAAKEFRRAIELQPDHAEAMNNLGNVLLQLGKTDEALAQYRKAFQIRPTYADALNNLGLALLQQGKLSEATGHFLAALDLRPQYADARNNLGYALLQQGRYADAEPQFRASIAIKNSVAQAHHNLALCLFALGRVKEALESYQNAIDVNAEQLGSINNLAWLLATTPDAALRNGNRSLELANQAMRLSGGTDPIVLHTLAAAQAELGRFSEAAATAERALGSLTTQHNPALVETVREQVRLYRAGTCFREAPAEPIGAKAQPGK